jgi:Gpi18-like mannosyltransferase
MRHEHAWAFLLFGLAVSFKLQAMFLLPLLGVIYLRRHFSIVYLLIVPFTYLVLVTPAVLAGMPWKAALSVYVDQVELYRKLTYNAPTIYQWIPNQYYEMFVPFGTALALAVALGITSMALLSRRRLSPDILIRMALAFTLVVPFVTPKMQDRYFFPADVLSVVYAFYIPRRFYVPLIVTLCSLFSYSGFLFDQTPVPMPFVSLALLVPVVVVVQDYATALFAGPAVGHQVAADDLSQVEVPVVAATSKV